MELEMVGNPGHQKVCDHSKTALRKDLGTV